MRDPMRLRAAIRRLLGCPALNLDDLEDEDRAAVREATSLLAGPAAPGLDESARTAERPADAARTRLVVRCPVCGERDPSSLQIRLPAWFRARVRSDGEGVPYFSPGEYVDPDADFDAHTIVYCESCGEVRDERDFVGKAEGPESCGPS